MDTQLSFMRRSSLIPRVLVPPVAIIRVPVLGVRRVVVVRRTVAAERREVSGPEGCRHAACRISCDKMRGEGGKGGWRGVHAVSVSAMVVSVVVLVVCVFFAVPVSASVMFRVEFVAMSMAVSMVVPVVTVVVAVAVVVTRWVVMHSSFTVRPGLLSDASMRHPMHAVHLRYASMSSTGLSLRFA